MHSKLAAETGSKMNLLVIIIVSKTPTATIDL